jgi:hypothetical protein
MKTEIIISGFGGQGVLSMGKILAYSGLMEDKEVTWMPAYGPEQRGGTANVTVIVSDSRISSPLIGRSIHDVAACDALLGSKLLHGLPGTEETLAAGGTDFNGIRCHMKLVCFRRRGVSKFGELHHSFGSIIHLGIPCLGIDILGISAYLVFYFHTVAGFKHALAHRNLLRFWQEILSLNRRCKQ